MLRLLQQTCQVTIPPYVSSKRRYFLWFSKNSGVSVRADEAWQWQPLERLTPGLNYWQWPHVVLQAHPQIVDSKNNFLTIDQCTERFIQHPSSKEWTEQLKGLHTGNKKNWMPTSCNTTLNTPLILQRHLLGKRVWTRRTADISQIWKGESWKEIFYVITHRRSTTNRLTQQVGAWHGP